MSPRIEAALVGGGLALTGALLVFIFTVIYTEIREARQRVRTLMGYARLLDDEIEANSRVLEMVQTASKISWMEVTSAWLSRPPTDEAWKAVREQLAPLMSPEDFRTLSEHYRLLVVLVDLVGHQTTSSTSDLTVWGVSSDLTDEAPRLRSMLSRYENPSRRKRWIGL